MSEDLIRGPWEYRTFDWDNGQPPQEYIVDAHSHVVADLPTSFYDENEVPEPRLKPIANLIAAAPEMFDALVALERAERNAGACIGCQMDRRRAVGYGLCRHYRDEMSEAHRLCKAALLKGQNK